MDDKKTSLIYRVLRYFIRLFSPKYTLLGTEHLPAEPCVIVGNHSQMFGPIAGELYTPGKHDVWCAGEMMVWKEVPAYAYRDFWSGKPRAVRWFYKLLSYAITPLAVCLFNNAHTVAVYHDTRLISTYRRSIERLEAGSSIVIFPEKNEKYNNILYAFQDKYVDLARFYYKRTGLALAFVPLYVCPKRAELHFGEAIRFDPAAPIAQERDRICAYLADAITEIASSLPEHTVVPYRNIRKRDYPKNTPVEVYTDEKACG